MFGFIIKLFFFLKGIPSWPVWPVLGSCLDVCAQGFWTHVIVGWKRFFAVIALLLLLVVGNDQYQKFSEWNRLRKMEKNPVQININEELMPLESGFYKYTNLGYFGIRDESRGGTGINVGYFGQTNPNDWSICANSAFQNTCTFMPLNGNEMQLLDTQGTFGKITLKEDEQKQKYLLLEIFRKPVYIKEE